MTRREILERVCKAVSQAGLEAFDCRLPADCFCGNGGFHGGDFCFSEDVMEWVEKVLSDAAKAKRAERKEP